MRAVALFLGLVRELNCHTSNLSFSHENKQILLCVTTWRDLEDIMLSAVGQTEEDKYYSQHQRVGEWLGGGGEWGTQGEVAGYRLSAIND